MTSQGTLGDPFELIIAHVIFVRIQFGNTAHTARQQHRIGTLPCLRQDTAQVKWYLLLSSVYTRHDIVSQLTSQQYWRFKWVAYISTWLRTVPYLPDMSRWTSGPIFSGHVRFFSRHRSWNVWWQFRKLCWAHDTMFFVVINVKFIINTTFNAHNN